jgi:hypothetical protein
MEQAKNNELQHTSILSYWYPLVSIRLDLNFSALVYSSQLWDRFQKGSQMIYVVGGGGTAEVIFQHMYKQKAWRN